jgi:hypothetical protein
MPQPIPEWVDSAEARLILGRLNDLEGALMVTQQQIDDYAGAVNTFAADIATATEGLRADLEALRAAIPPEVDTTSLDTNMTRLGAASAALQGLDAANPPAPPSP